jgi:hypothetical protein
VPARHEDAPEIRPTPAVDVDYVGRYLSHQPAKPEGHAQVRLPANPQRVDVNTGMLRNMLPKGAGFRDSEMGLNRLVRGQSAQKIGDLEGASVDMPAELEMQDLH